MFQVTQKVPLEELPSSLSWVVKELGLADQKGRVSREHVRTLGEFVVRFGPPPTPGAAGPAERPRRGRPPKTSSTTSSTTTSSSRTASATKTRMRARPTKAEVRGELTRRIAEHLRTHPGSTLREIAAALKAPLTDVSVAARPVDWLILDDSEVAAPSQRTESAAIVATRERARAALQAASLLAGPLSHQSYTTLVREGRVKGPSVARIVQLFGSWTSACAEVGVASGEPLRKNYERRWTRDEILDHVERFLSEPTYRGASHQFDTWRAASNGDGSVPSLGTVRNLVGGTWNEIRTTALRRMRARWVS